MSIIAWVVQTTYGEWLEIEAYHDARTTLEFFIIPI